MVDIVDNMALVAMVDSNAKVYILKKMVQVGPKRAPIECNCPRVIQIGPNLPQLYSIGPD